MDWYGKKKMENCVSKWTKYKWLLAVATFGANSSEEIEYTVDISFFYLHFGKKQLFSRVQISNFIHFCVQLIILPEVAAFFYLHIFPAAEKFIFFLLVGRVI